MQQILKQKTRENINRPAVVLAEDVLDSLCQGEGLASAVGPNDEDWGQGNWERCGDSQDSLFLLGIQTGIQLLVPLPEGVGRMEKILEESSEQLLFNLQNWIGFMLSQSNRLSI